MAGWRGAAASAAAAAAGSALGRVTVYDVLAVALALSHVRVKVTVTVPVLTALAVKVVVLVEVDFWVHAVPLVSATLRVSLAQMFSLTVSVMAASLAVAGAVQGDGDFGRLGAGLDGSYLGRVAFLAAACWLRAFAGACLVAAIAPLAKTAGTMIAMARADFGFTGDSGSRGLIDYMRCSVGPGCGLARDQSG